MPLIIETNKILMVVLLGGLLYLLHKNQSTIRHKFKSLINKEEKEEKEDKVKSKSKRAHKKEKVKENKVKVKVKEEIKEEFKEKIKTKEEIKEIKEVKEDAVTDNISQVSLGSLGDKKELNLDENTLDLLDGNSTHSNNSSTFT
jgi:hypothetical protein